MKSVQRDRRTTKTERDYNRDLIHGQGLARHYALAVRVIDEVAADPERVSTDPWETADLIITSNEKLVLALAGDAGLVIGEAGEDGEIVALMMPVGIIDAQFPGVRVAGRVPTLMIGDDGITSAVASIDELTEAVAPPFPFKRAAGWPLRVVR